LYFVLASTGIANLLYSITSRVRYICYPN